MPTNGDTYAHCSMLASAWSMTARFLRFPTFSGSTVFRANATSRGGISGGLGALEERWPIDFSWPVRNRCTACLVRSTCTSTYQLMNTQKHAQSAVP